MICIRCQLQKPISNFGRHVRSKSGRISICKLCKLTKRFWAKVRKTKTCWLWVGAKGRDGYGHIRVNGHMVGAHRVAWELTRGPIPKRRWVLHRCDRGLCVRHLFLGNHRVNMQDKVRKGRQWFSPRGEKNPCAILTQRQVDRIRIELTEGGHGIGAQLARRFRVGKSTITRIKQGRVYP